MEPIRYSAAACQTDLPNPLDRTEMKANTNRMLSMVDSAMAGAAPFLPVRLVVFPEFAHAAPVYPTLEELAHEFSPSLYTRLWLWILAPEDKRARYRSDLEELLEHPPQNVTEWDARLGRFALGQGWDEEFVEAARAELARRLDAGEAPGDLMAEVWFYIGLRHEQQAQRGSDEFRIEELTKARDAYRGALAEDPTAFKWEWEYARNGFARVAAELDASQALGFAIENGGFTAADGAPLVHASAFPGGSIASLRVHSVGNDAARTADPADLESIRPGDLVLVSLRDEAGGLSAVRLVIDAR